MKVFSDASTFRGLVLLTLAFLCFGDVIGSDEEFLFYDVKASNPQDVIDGFSGLSVLHIFKVSTVERYFVVVQNDHSPALQDLVIPKAVKVTEYPVGNVCNFLSGFGIRLCDERVDATFPDGGTFNFIKFELRFPESMSSAQVRHTLTQLKDRYSSYLADSEALVFNVAAKYPHRLFFLTDQDMEAAEQMVDAMVAEAGHGNVVANVLRIREIPNQ